MAGNKSSHQKLLDNKIPRRVMSELPLDIKSALSGVGARTLARYPHFFFGYAPLSSPFLCELTHLRQTLKEVVLRILCLLMGGGSNWSRQVVVEAAHMGFSREPSSFSDRVMDGVFACVRTITRLLAPASRRRVARTPEP